MVGLLFVTLLLSVKGCGNAMHLALDGKRGFVYTLRPKGKNDSIAFTPFYRFIAYLPQIFPVFVTVKIVK